MGKLGQLLLQAGLITGKQLKVALDSQQFYHFRLGSYFIEKGILQADQLAEFLSRKLKVPFAPAELFANIPADVIGLVDGQAAEKYAVVPLALEKRRLMLAMADPCDLPAIDDLAFRTGRVIRPMVAPETVIIQNLQRYYGINPSEIFTVPLSIDDFDGESPLVETQLEEFPLLGGPEQDAIMDAWERKRYEEHQAEIRAREAGEPPEPFQMTSLKEPPAPFPVSLEQVLEGMPQLSDRESMADLVMSYLASEFGNGALFQIRGGMATGWRGVINRKPAARFDGLRFSLDSPSLLKTVAETKTSFLGTIPSRETDRAMFREVGAESGQEVLLVPVQLAGRMVALLYAENRKLNLQVMVVDLQKVATALGEALEALILKNKLAKG